MQPMLNIRHTRRMYVNSPFHISTVILNVHACIAHIVSISYVTCIFYTRYICTYESECEANKHMHHNTNSR